MIIFKLLHPRATHEMLGMIPYFLSEHDKRPAREQFDTAYRHGGGWNPTKRWTYDPATRSIKYPGDPSIGPLAEARLRDETIFIYPHA